MISITSLFFTVLFLTSTVSVYLAYQSNIDMPQIETSFLEEEKEEQDENLKKL